MARRDVPGRVCRLWLTCYQRCFDVRDRCDASLSRSCSNNTRCVQISLQTTLKVCKAIVCRPCNNIINNKAFLFPSPTPTQSGGILSVILCSRYRLSQTMAAARGGTPPASPRWLLLARFLSCFCSLSTRRKLVRFVPLWAFGRDARLVTRTGAFQNTHRHTRFHERVASDGKHLRGQL